MKRGKFYILNSSSKIRSILKTKFVSYHIPERFYKLKNLAFHENEALLVE